MRNINFVCTKCGEIYMNETTDFRCNECGEPLEIEGVREGKIYEGDVLNQSILSRYRDFYPYLDANKDISLGEGFTPLIKSPFLAEKIGVRNIYFKDESQNPTWSFKDRGTLTGVLRAMDLGYKRIGTVSTGNMAASVAAYGAMAKMETYIFVSESIADEKLKPIAIYNPHLIKVQGDYGDLYKESFEIGKEKGIYFINSDAPFRVEGYKTIAFEICEQLNFNIPDFVIVPTSAGGNIRGIEKGFREFLNCGLIDKHPKMICVQASGCSPITSSYEKGEDTVKRFDNPNTIAQAINNPTPPSGNQVLRMLRKNGGTSVSVSDEEIIKAQTTLASIGIFGQPASATSLAAIKKLKNSGYLTEDDSIVSIITASGLKYTKALDYNKLQYSSCKIDEITRFIE